MKVSHFIFKLFNLLEFQELMEDLLNFQIIAIMYILFIFDFIMDLKILRELKIDKYLKIKIAHPNFFLQ